MRINSEAISLGMVSFVILGGSAVAGYRAYQTHEAAQARAADPKVIAGICGNMASESDGNTDNACPQSTLQFLERQLSHPYDKDLEKKAVDGFVLAGSLCLIGGITIGMARSRLSHDDTPQNNIAYIPSSNIVS